MGRTPNRNRQASLFIQRNQARIPRTAMRAAWLRTREGTRRLTAKEQQDGQYREAASLEEHAADTAVSAAEAAAGATLRGGKRVAQQVAQKRQTEKATGQAEQAAEQARVQQLGRRPLCRLNRAIEAPEFYLI